MAEMRCKVTMDFRVPDGVDPDVFHDTLRQFLEEDLPEVSFDVEDDEGNEMGVATLDTIRDIEVEVLTD